MEFSEIIGYIAATLTTISFIPGAWHIHKTHDTKAISLKMYILFVTGVFCWLIYGIIINKSPIIIANLITIILAGFILFKKIKEKSTNS